MADLKTRLSEILDRLVGTRGVAGLAVVARPGLQPETVWVPSSSLAEPAFLAYSITKTFTAVLLLLLQEEGRLTLDNPLARWFPRIVESERISLRQLLNHTAGIPDYGPLRSYHEAVRTSPQTPWSFERFAAETFDKGLRFPPGTGWEYSNPAYMLLKRIAEEVSGTNYAALVTERIARPLGLSRTFVPESLEGLASLAAAPSLALSPDGSPRDVRAYYHPGWVSHGVVASTPSEIVRFLDALFRGGLISHQSLDEMTALVPVSESSATDSQEAEPERSWSRPSYGLGLMGDPASPWGVVWGHNGGGPGYSASAFHAPELGRVSVCAMTGIEDFQAEQLVFAVFDDHALDATGSGA
ncbi:MAG TPA: serine hydrolase domain-containing protein [Thermoanaerobaculia bacterium]|nr:serine hydrolase domain-containing protein [Thermoanaerobaculia bacterium]